MADIAQFCANPESLAKSCPGICANEAIAGIGTRVALYIQAVSAGERIPQSLRLFVKRMLIQRICRPFSHLARHSEPSTACVVHSGYHDPLLRAERGILRQSRIPPRYQCISCPLDRLLHLRYSRKRYAAKPPVRFLHSAHSDTRNPLPQAQWRTLCARSRPHSTISSSSSHTWLSWPFSFGWCALPPPNRPSALRCLVIPTLCMRRLVSRPLCFPSPLASLRGPSRCLGFCSNRF